MSHKGIDSPCEKQLRLVIDNLPSMIAYVDASKKYRIINRAYHEYFGASKNEIIGKHVSEVLGNKFYNIVEKYIDTALSGKSTSWETHHFDTDNNERILSVSLVPYIDTSGDNNGYLVVVADITEEKQSQIRLETLNNSLEGKIRKRTKQLVKELCRRKKHEKKLRQLAYQDPLTGLLNRRSFSERVDCEISRSHRYKSELSYMIIDIDRFKMINDAHGHWIGDAVLKEFANKIVSLLRENDFIGRIGGEEFAIVLPNTSEKAAQEMGERIRKEVEKHIVRYKDTSINFTVSIGISNLALEEKSIENVFCRADTALFLAKNSGRNRVCVAS
jgi:diguanylate cyclase (GGDEF)-like protein/PAS domain S-box-containing protein